VIRGSDDTETARTRLMQIFDLSETQANYILEMPLRRLTKFSRLELEKEQAQLRETIEQLDALLGDENLLRQVVSDELADVAKEHGTPRRTVLLESAGQTVSAAVPLEVTDDPCWVLMSATGLLARTGDDSTIPDEGGRSKHDVVVSAVRATARGEVGVLTRSGELHKLDVLDLPTLPSTASAPHLRGGAPISEFLAVGNDDIVCLVSFVGETPGLAIGTRNGVVKRVRDEYIGKDSWEVITLKDDDQVVGARQLVTGDEQLCFITSDAQLLHFNASLVRPQGRSGGGVAGVKVGAGARVVSFTAFEPGDDAVVATIAGSADALPGTETGAVKVAPFAEYPSKGRATGGVRCHRLLKGESGLTVAWAGHGPAMATASSGSPVELPAADGRRDGSGVPAQQPVRAIAGPAAGQVPG
ncbi:MAG: DNA topoisomerase IV, partial [Actinomycetia bacterium]|nr:DNA topoisomerase IV [Actinomycetes bacterium]